MIRVNLEEILKAKGKTIYALCKETGLTPHNLAKLVKGENKSISFDALEKICLNLDCDICDVLKLIKDENIIKE